MNQYCRDTFGRKLYKVAINGGFTCPNRDGTLGTGGCIFCSGEGSGDFAESASLSVTEQIERGIKRVASKMPKGEKKGIPGSLARMGGNYIAYFQAFTNTYGPVEKLRSLFTEAIHHPDIAVLSIATRPDCLPPEVLELLAGLNRIKPVWVELGLQTIHEKTAHYIRRGYELPVFDLAVKQLKEQGLNVIVHVILGLPGETREMMLQTVDYVGKCGADGIKLQLLHVLEGTDLAADYRAGKVPVMTLEEYTDLVVECVKLLPPHMVIHRLTGDGDKRKLLAPLWSGDKKRVLNTLKSKLNR